MRSVKSSKGLDGSDRLFVYLLESAPETSKLDFSETDYFFLMDLRYAKDKTSREVSKESNAEGMDLLTKMGMAATRAWINPKLDGCSIICDVNNPRKVLHVNFCTTSYYSDKNKALVFKPSASFRDFFKAANVETISGRLIKASDAEIENIASRLEAQYIQEMQKYVTIETPKNPNWTKAEMMKELKESSEAIKKQKKNIPKESKSERQRRLKEARKKTSKRR